MLWIWKGTTLKALQAGVFLALTMVMAGPVRSDPLDGAAIQGPAQHYVMTLPEAPVDEIAQEVLGETLGLPVTVDDRIEARMGFRVDGLYSPRELAREFGYRLWNVDVALIEDPADGLMLIPASALPDAVKDGGRVVSPLALDPTAPEKTSTLQPRTPASYGERRWDQTSTGLFVVGPLGWLIGFSTCAGAVWLRRSQRHPSSPAPTPLLLTAREGSQPAAPGQKRSAPRPTVQK